MPSSPEFSTERAERVQTFFERLLCHTKGRFARAPFRLTDWQREGIVWPLFGSVRYDEQFQREVRRYRLAWIELARKNGKSELLAGIALYLLCADREEGAEVYGAASDREQAGLVFQVAKRMVELSPLARRLKVIDSRKRIIDPRTDSYYQVIAADAAGNLGQNPHGIVFDEVIAQPNRELWDALKSGMGTREQPLMVAATTAGADPSGFAADEHRYSERVAQDPELDRARLVFMRNMPTEADWRDEANWYWPNPALGDFLSIETLRDDRKEALQKPSAENAFRQFRGNQWVAQHVRWIPMHLWDSCEHLFVDSELQGNCYAGLSVGAVTDLTAWCLVFPNDGGPDAPQEVGYQARWRFWLPEDKLSDLDERTAGQGSTWARDGFIELTPGDMTDFDVIERRITEDADRYEIVECGFPPWQGHQLVGHLQDGGMAMVPVRQTIQVLTEPSKALETLVAKGALAHNNNPVARWMVANVALKRSPDGDFCKPDKEHSGDTIAGVSAALNALERAIRAEPVPEANVTLL